MWSVFDFGLKFTACGRFFKSPEDVNQRNYKNSAEEIADSVNGIKGQACCNPGYSFFKAESEEQSLCGSKESPEEKAVAGAYCHVNQRSSFFRQIFRENHDCSPEDGPDVEVGKPPQGKASKKTLQKNIGVNGVEGFSSINHSESYDEYSYKVDIRNEGHGGLGYVHNRANNPENRNFPG